MGSPLHLTEIREAESRMALALISIYLKTVSYAHRASKASAPRRSRPNARRTSATLIVKYPGSELNPSKKRQRIQIVGSWQVLSTPQHFTGGSTRKIYTKYQNYCRRSHNNWPIHQRNFSIPLGSRTCIHSAPAFPIVAAANTSTTGCQQKRPTARCLMCEGVLSDSAIRE